MSKLVTVVIGVLFSSLATGTASWFAFGADRPNRVEVGEMIATQSPYVADKRFLDATIVELAITTRELRAAVGSLTVEVVELRLILAQAIEGP